MTQEIPSLLGKVAVVTGAASGIGRATATLLAQRGASVCIVDWNADGGEETAAQIRSEGGTASFQKVDVSKAAEVESLMDTLLATYGRLDILVNNAAVQILGTLTETSEESWDRIHDVNLKGVFLCCKYAIPLMIGRVGATIVNVASVLGIVADPDLTAYCAAKGGVISLTKAAALTYGPQGIRINCICPGDVETQLVKEYFDNNADPVAFRQEVYSNYALKRIASPTEVAKAIAFLASDEASFMAGSTLIVDGGLTVKCY
jgi:NAD(P)-dependent dehydrogenase (short-subunit alcohol dehydrogenase family)